MVLPTAEIDRPPLGRAFSHAAPCPAGTQSKTIWVNRTDPDRAPDHVIFRTYWTIAADEGEAIAVLSDVEKFSTWWGRTFLATDVIHRPDTGLLGFSGKVTSRGFLPYIFCWTACVIAADADAVRLSAVGDFEGIGTFRRPGPDEQADLCFDWDVRISKPILRFFCPAACRVYLWNHAYAMAEGARALNAEISKRRG